MKRTLPRPSKSKFVRLKRETYLRMAQMLERVEKMQYAPPLYLQELGGAPCLSVSVTPAQQTWVKLTSSSYTPPGGSPITLGVGRFAGEILTPATAATDLTTNLVEADVGTSTGQTVVVYNMSEVGLSTRNLTATDLPYIVPCVFWRTLASGAPVYLFFDAQWNLCG